MPAIEMNYIIVVMIFPKTPPTVTFFTSPCLCVCVHAHMHLCAVLFHENVEIVFHCDNLLQVPSLWSEMIEAHIHLILTNQNLTEVLLIFSFHH